MNVLLVLFMLLIADILRSAISMLLVKKRFDAQYKGIQGTYKLGKGPKLSIAVVGDSGIDGHHSNKTTFGPYSSCLQLLAKNHTLEIHVFANQGAKTGDVLQQQLPKVKTIKHLDMIFVYMGANNIIRGFGAAKAAQDFALLLDYAKKSNTLVIASEVADYYLLRMFSYIHRLFIYFANTSLNKKLALLRRHYDNFILLPIPGLTRKYFNTEHQADGLHPNDKGLRVWGKVLADEMKQDTRIKRFL